MEQQQQPQRRRGRQPKVEPQLEPQAQEECPLPQPECPLPDKKKKSDLPPGAYRKALPDGGYMIVHNGFRKGAGQY